MAEKEIICKEVEFEGRMVTPRTYVMPDGRKYTMIGGLEV